MPRGDGIALQRLRVIRWTSIGIVALGRDRSQRSRLVMADAWVRNIRLTPAGRRLLQDQDVREAADVWTV